MPAPEGRTANVAALGAGVDGPATLRSLAEAYAVLGRRGVDRAGRRVVSAASADAVVALLEAAVARDDATGKEARLPDVRVGGKTGTFPRDPSDPARGMRGTFVGLGPLPAPRFVVALTVETHAPGYAGGTVAAPLFPKVLRALL